MVHGTDGALSAKRKARFECGKATAHEANKASVSSSPVIVCEHASQTVLMQALLPVREVLTNHACAILHLNGCQRQSSTTANCSKRRATVRQHEKWLFPWQSWHIVVLIVQTNQRGGPTECTST